MPNGTILQVVKKRVGLFDQYFRERLAEVERESEDEGHYKCINLSKDRKRLYLVDTNDDIYIYNILENEIKEDREFKEFLIQNSSILSEKYKIANLMESKITTESSEEKVYFLGSLNSSFEIFTRHSKIFESKENLIKLPSLITDKNDSRIQGIRVFTDFTVPLKIEEDEEMYKHPSKCAQEMYYHTLGDNIYVFVVLINGHLQIYKQVLNLNGEKYEIVFKKVNIPQLLGKKMKVEFQEFLYKEQSSLNFKRARSNTATEMMHNPSEVKKMARNLIKIMQNGMVYIRDFSLVLHEIQGRLLTYQVTKSASDLSELRAIETWY